MAGATERIHATCVAFGDRGILLRGPSGAGKSDLALRLIHLDSPWLDHLALEACRLVADDQVLLAADDGRLVAAAPPTLQGRLEVRGVGILAVPSLPTAVVALAVDLVPAAEPIERLPEPGETAEFAGVAVPLIRCHGFEASAPLKIALALANLSHYADPASRRS